MNKTVSILLFSCATAITASAAQITRLVPSFPEHVLGSRGSVWQSEIRLFNASDVSQLVTMANLFSGGGNCVGFQSLTIPAGSLAQLRSIGCEGPGFAAFEIRTDDSVQIAAVITNIGVTAQSSCCLSGYTQNIPVIPVAEAYKTLRTAANLQVPVVNLSNIGRHNLIFVNPNDSTIVVRLRYFSDTGIMDDPPIFPNVSVSVAPKSYVQLNDVLPQPNLTVTPPVILGYWRIEASAAAPFYFFDSYVDNSTGDATTIESH
jgi:hypothetical protein